MRQRGLILLLLCATLAFTAGTYSLSLLSLDDCFYARKGIEHARSGRFFTVTWNYQVAFQNPPLPFWILGRSFLWFGENDFSARLPSILMALGILLATYRIGILTVGKDASLAGISLLLVSPHFVSNARRCMLEIPTTFWITICFLLLLEGLRRPRLHALVAIPLGGALLTKSLLGLLPVAVYGLFCIWNREARTALKKPWLWIGCAGGIGIGASWPLHQWQNFGSDALRSHYLGEIAARSASKLPFLKRIYGYPAILLGAFQPVILPALAGFRLLWPRKTEPTWLLFCWALFPVVAYSFSSAQSSRYIFPIFPALALCGGYALVIYLPKAAGIFHKWITPAILVVLAAVFWIRPGLLVRDENRVLKDQAQQFQRLIPEEEPLAYTGNSYWKHANPLLYYADRFLEPPAGTTREAMDRAKIRVSKSILCDKDFLPQVKAAGDPITTVMEDNLRLIVTLKN